MSSQNLPLFDLPDFTENSTGWGPNAAVNNGVLKEFEGLPYQHFNKGDRIGRIVDWLGGDRYYKKNEIRDRYNERMYGSSATAGALYDYVHDNEDANFQLVDSTKPQRPQKTFRQRYQFRKLVPKEQGRDYEKFAGAMTKTNRSIVKEQMKAYKLWQRRGGGARGGNMGRTPGQRRFHDRQGGKGRQPSINVKPDWVVLEELDFPRLNKLTLPGIEPGKDIDGHTYGALNYYDKSIDKVNVKQAIPLERCQGGFYNLTTSEDPVMQKLAMANTGNVFATDMILATLMATSRSVNSWDIVANRVGDKLFFDKRATTGVSPIDELTVSETAQDPPTTEPTGPNNAKDLAKEALYINQNFRRQVLLRNEKDKTFKFENEKIPFEEEGQKADCAYKYRIWKLGSTPAGTPITLVSRVEHDAVMVGSNKEVQKLTIKCFNEWDSSQSGGVDWRTKLDIQKGAVLATEMKNNSCKLAKWTLQAILAGSDYIKLGYVSRMNLRNSTQHVILGTQQFRPSEFAHSIALSLDNCWGVLRMIIDYLMKQPSGKYLLLKDPTQPVVRIYSLPEGTFDSSEEEASDEASGSEGEAD